MPAQCRSGCSLASKRMFLNSFVQKIYCILKVLMRMNLELGNLWRSEQISTQLVWGAPFLCSVVYWWIRTVLFMHAAISKQMSLYVFITSLVLFAFTVFSSAFYADSHPVFHFTPPPTPTPLPHSDLLRLHCLPQLFSVALCALCCRTGQSCADWD